MQVESFPFRLDSRTQETLADLVALMSRREFSFQATVGRTQVLFFNKQEGVPIDVPINFATDFITIHYSLNAIAKYNPTSRKWLQDFHRFLISKHGNLTPVIERCGVSIEARHDGQLRYFLTYMTAHDDGSLAQDMPQGKLYHTESLFMPASPAQPAKPAASSQPEPAAWLTDSE